MKKKILEVIAYTVMAVAFAYCLGMYLALLLRAFATGWNLII